jgi:uncharacterized protein
MTAATMALLAAAGVWAGMQNAIAGGGSFITLPALIVAGLDARAANITSSVALFPGQIVSGWANRSLVSAPPGVALPVFAGLSLLGGAVGAGLLLLTPAPTFAAMLPWLVLAATLLFAWGAFGRGPAAAAVSPRRAGAVQFAIAIYGGYFGGGIGFLMLAALTIAGMAVRPANATKNALAACMNAAAFGVFAFSGHVAWAAAGVLCSGAIAGSMIGAKAIHIVPEKALKILVVVIGISLFAGLLVRG